MDNSKIPSYKEGLEALKGNLSNMLPPEALQVFEEDAQALQQEHSSIIKLQVGDKAPDFTLSNAINESVNLYDVLKKNKVVLTFYRGTWCPYCNLVLNQYQAVLPEMKKAGATLMAISPQTPDESLNIKEKNTLQFEVLSDNGNIVSKQFTAVHKNPEKSLSKMKELGFEYDSFYADEGSEIPVPATFIIEQDGTISFAQSEGGDYRNRVEAADIINSLNK